MDKDIAKYYSLLKEIKTLAGISSLLEWDQENQMPEAAGNERADQLAAIQKLIHKKSTSSEYKKTVNKLNDNLDKLDPVVKRSVQLSKKNMDKSSKLSSKFVSDFAALKSKAMQAWVEAKQKNDFKLFEPLLSKMFDKTRQYAEYIDSSKSIYNVLLDDYEENATTEMIDKIFKVLREELKVIIPKISEKKRIGVFETGPFEEAKTKEMIWEITKTIGFDYNRGTMGKVHHPFQNSVSDNDVRINVSYKENDIAFTITAGTHELGHGLYEQNINPEYYKTAFGNGLSLILHESQSRLLENIIGRSEGFWKYFLTIVQKYYPQTNKFSAADAVNDLNIVKPSFIRIESDEVTYNMHIILRYEIEQMVLNKEIKVKEIPEVWNSKMKELLGIVPENHAKGSLQDVHWSMGAIGYFATYALGNLAAAQLWRKFKIETPNFEDELSSGNLSSYLNWFKKNLWQYGGMYTSSEILERVTGEPLNQKYFVEYIKEKFL